MKKVLLIGPILTRSGYGEQSRFALRALRSRPDLFDIYIHPTQWGHTSWLFEDTEERIWIDQTIEKSLAYANNGGHFDMTLQVTIPLEWKSTQGHTIDIGYTAGIETTKVAHQWIELGNALDRIIVVSEHSKKVYEETSYDVENSETGAHHSTLTLQTPVDVVNYPVKKYENLPELDLGVTTDFNFLTVAQWAPRKNLENTIKWFVEEFHDDNVGLILKTNMAKNCHMDYETTLAKLEALLSEYKDRKCKVYLLHGDMTDEEIHSLYFNEKTSAFMLLTHGEGFGLPLFEAAYSGMPIVAVGWSGQADFLHDSARKSTYYDVAYDLHPIQEGLVWEGVLIKESMWAYAREASAKTQMRQCYEDLTGENKEEILAKTCEHAKYLSDTFSEEAMYAKFVSSFEHFLVDENEDEFTVFLRENEG